MFVASTTTRHELEAELSVGLITALPAHENYDPDIERGGDQCDYLPHRLSYVPLRTTSTSAQSTPTTYRNSNEPDSGSSNSLPNSSAHDTTHTGTQRKQY